MTSVCGTEIKRFCRLTSLKGISRAAKAERNHLRWTWVVGSLALLSLSAWGVVQLTSNYFGYPQVP